ncbi:MAG: 16S rRNA (guanine(966)-N(2))-methyltransferase RsmD [Gammaproteobacteria bacterium]
MSRSTRPGRVRIIGGRWRGRFIDIPQIPGLRPTPNRVRETLFNWLAPEIEGAHCVDLYAGSGALGIEALSRGAASVTFVESNMQLVTALRAQLERLGATPDVVRDTAAAFLARTSDSFDLAFADPPFEVDPQPVCDALAGRLRPGGALYCERSAANELPALEWGEWQRQSRAGDVRFGLARAAAIH